MLYRVWNLLVIETLAYLRNKTSFFWTFAYPIILLVVLMTIFGGGRGNYSSTIEVFDSSDGKASNAYLNLLKEKVSHIDSFTLEIVTVSEASPIEPGRIRLVFPRDFGAKNSDYSEVTLSVRGTSDAGLGALIALIGENIEVFNRLETSAQQRFALAYDIVADKPEIMDYRLFLIVGLAALTVVSTALFGFSAVLVDMRAAGAFKMLQVFPLKKSEFLIAFLISRVVILTVFCVLFIYFFGMVYGVALPIDLWTIFNVAMMVFLGSVAFMAFGLIIAGVITKTSTATAVVNLVNIPVIFLSDLFIPMSIMPDTIQIIAKLSPVYAFVNALREIAGNGASMSSHWTIVSYLVIFSLVCMVLAAATFKWRLE